MPAQICRPPVNFTLIRGIFAAGGVWAFFWKGKPVIGSNFSFGTEAGCVIKSLKSGDSLELLLLDFAVQSAVGQMGFLLPASLSLCNYWVNFEERKCLSNNVIRVLLELFSSNKIRTYWTSSKLFINCFNDMDREDYTVLYKENECQGSKLSDLVGIWLFVVSRDFF